MTRTVLFNRGTEARALTKTVSATFRVLHKSAVIFHVVAALAITSFSAQAAEFNLQTATIEDINKAFDAGALTSEKLTQLYLNRIAAYDQQGPKLNTIITLNQRTHFVPGGICLRAAVPQPQNTGQCPRPAG